jgi:hypothetical protein
MSNGDTDITPSSPAAEPSAVAPKVEATAAPTTTPAIENSQPAQAKAPAAEIKATAAELGASRRAENVTDVPSVLLLPHEPRRSPRFALLAATIAIAAGLGVAGGAWGAYRFAQASFTPVKVAKTAPANDKTIALQNTVARMQTELAALRTSVDAGNRATNGQFAKITERFDRVDRSQTERAAKFAKAVETLERLEKRADAAPARETTGSVPAPAVQPQPVSAPAAPPVQQQQQQQAQTPQQPILEGWVVRNVYRGTAIVQSRRFGTIDVEPGDMVPGVGRIETIKKQDGRWVVVTSRGLIVSMR